MIVSRKCLARNIFPGGKLDTRNQRKKAQDLRRLRKQLHSSLKMPLTQPGYTHMTAYSLTAALAGSFYSSCGTSKTRHCSGSIPEYSGLTWEVTAVQRRTETDKRTESASFWMLLFNVIIYPSLSEDQAICIFICV